MDETNTNTNDIEQAITAEEAAAEAIHVRLEELEGELAAARERHLRLAAEFDNYRKRIAREQSEMLARAQAVLIAKLVDVIDDLDRVAHHSGNASKEALLEGVELVERKFRGVLEGSGLERIDPAGQPFDPAIMEALTAVPTDRPEEDHLVGEVFQYGYRFQGTLVRPARVVVKKYEG
ncbi:MAG: nucleotide exchange factor GrpE, partial [Gemmatimonadota bacterium]